MSPEGNVGFEKGTEELRIRRRSRLNCDRMDRIRSCNRERGNANYIDVAVGFGARLRGPS